MRIFAIALLAALAIAGCTRSNAIALNENTVQISTRAAPVCGGTGAQESALKTAAIETITRGFDAFHVLDGSGENTVRVVGTTPITTHSTGTYSGTMMGNSMYGSMSGTSQTYGGQPIIMGGHNQTYVVRMLKADDPGAGQAINARMVLGPDWAQIAADGPASTCF